jgi:hypothetical protein
MISGRLFYTILAISFCGLLAAIFAPGSLKPAGRSWQLMVCTGRYCPPRWTAAVVSQANPKSMGPVQKAHKA